MTRLSFVVAACASLLPAAARAQAPEPPSAPMAHFHHVHFNTTDPDAAIEFYTTKFKARREKFAGADAVWTGDSWLLFTRVSEPPPSELVAPIWHIGWGAEDMKATYQKQLDSGTRFATPLTDISAMVGGRSFFFAYVDGPDHALIELNTAAHHSFGHVHLFSADPPAAAEWYAKHFGLPGRAQPEKRVYNGDQIGPSAGVAVDHVNMILYPIEYIRGARPEVWKDRAGFASTRGRVIDHLGFSVENLDAALARLRQDGVKVLAEPSASADGKLELALVEGPDQIAIELIEDRTPRPAPIEPR